jgi:hypothetical protein
MSIVLYIPVFKKTENGIPLAQYILEVKKFVCRPDDGVNYTPKHVAI